MKLIWSDHTRTVRRDNMTIVLKHAESRGFRNWLVTERLQRKQSIQRTVDTKLTAIAESAPAIVTGKVYRQDTEVAGAQLAIIYGVKEDRWQSERITGEYRFVVCMAAEADRAALAAFGKQVSK